MSDFSGVIQQLQNQKTAIESQLQRVNAAVAALKGIGKTATGRMSSRRVMSASARRRIAAAQKTRWAKWRAMKKRAA
jgi:hypothetical protein